MQRTVFNKKPISAVTDGANAYFVLSTFYVLCKQHKIKACLGDIWSAHPFHF